MPQLPSLCPKPNHNPALAVVIWKGGARERADDVFCLGHKKRGRKANFATTWCRWPDSNRYAVASGGFWVIQAIRNLMAWTGTKRSFPSLSKTSKTRKSLIKSAFSTQSTKSTSNSSPPRLSATRYPIWGAGGMLEGCKQDIPPANSYRGHTH